MANLNRRQPSIVVQQPLPSQQQQQQQQRNVNRHSFAMGDTQNLGKLFGKMGTDWFSSNNNNDDDQSQSQQQQQPQQQHPLQQPQPRTTIPSNRSQHHQLRPKSVMELGGGVLDPTFSNTWLNQRQSSLSSNVIERPRSADISSWALPTSNSSSSISGSGGANTASWKPLHNQHDIDINLWKDPITMDISAAANTRRSSSAISSTAAAAATSNLRKSNFSSHYLAAPSSSSPSATLGGGKAGTSRTSSFESIANDFGYGSDQSDASTTSRRFKQSYQQPTQKSAFNSSNNKPIIENKEDHVDMDLIKGKVSNQITEISSLNNFLLQMFLPGLEVCDYTNTITFLNTCDGRILYN